MNQLDEAHVTNALKALEHFQYDRTIPLIYDPDGVDFLLGTGVLITVKGRYFIITAAHLFEDYAFDARKVACPDTRAPKMPTPLGKCNFAEAPRSPFDYDAAVIELFDPRKIAALKKEWEFLEVGQLSLPTKQDVFCLGGFPVERVGRLNDFKTLQMTVIRTYPTDGIPDNAGKYRKGTDIFGQYAEEGTIRQENRIGSTPRLQGVSGGSLFRYRPTKRRVWSASKTMKLVGIQSSAMSDKSWFKAKSIRSILRAFSELDRTLARHISKVTNVKIPKDRRVTALPTTKKRTKKKKTKKKRL